MRFKFAIYCVTVALLAGSWLMTAAAWSQEPPSPPDTAEEAPEVLTRGPIHEAFAEPVTDPKPGIIVPKQPPADIEEVPPEYAPDLEGAIWIKGYWAWDDEMEDFIWVSGVHRVPPPGMRWVAGFWNGIEGEGWQWNRGFWMKADEEELSYRPELPDSLESGPSSPSPGDDYYYVPGHWVYEDDYRWSPGYWAVYQPDCVWVPAHWVWTPAGYIFIPGYCDYRITRRGCLYAPVYFRTAFYARPGYYYRPWCALNIGNLMVHFWVRPNYCHYYFGNYYGGWGSWGLTPWYTWHHHHHHHHYDPILSWTHTHYRRQGINYIDRVGGWHKHYERHEHDRPPRTWNDQVKLVSQNNITNITQINKITNVTVKQNILAAKVDDMAKLEDAPVKLRHLEKGEQETARKRAKLDAEEIAEVRNQRRKFEKGGKLASVQPGEVKLPEGVKSGAAGDAAKGDKGDRQKGGGKGKADATTTARASGGKLKLPQARIKSTLPIKDSAPRGTPRTDAGGDDIATGGQKSKGVKGSKAGSAVEARTKVGATRRDEPDDDGPRKSGKGPMKLGSPKVDLPSVDSGAGKSDSGPSLPGKGSKAGETKPRDSSPRKPTIDRTPKIERRDSKPEVELPRSDGPPATSGGSAPRLDAPTSASRIGRSGDDADGPRLSRPSLDRAGGNGPQIESRGTLPKVETPRVPPRSSSSGTEAPRIEPRVQPRTEVPRAQPRIQPSSQPRIESSAPRSSSSSERSQPRRESRSTRKRD